MQFAAGRAKRKAITGGLGVDMVVDVADAVEKGDEEREEGVGNANRRADCVDGDQGGEGAIATMDGHEHSSGPDEPTTATAATTTTTTTTTTPPSPTTTAVSTAIQCIGVGGVIVLSNRAPLSRAQVGVDVVCFVLSCALFATWCARSA